MRTFLILESICLILVAIVAWRNYQHSNELDRKALEEKRRKHDQWVAARKRRVK